MLWKLSDTKLKLSTASRKHSMTVCARDIFFVSVFAYRIELVDLSMK